MFEVLDEFCGEPCWDHNLTWNTSAPNVTPCMEATLLAWIPCGLLWVFAPLEMYFQKTSVSKPLPWTRANISRMLIPLALALLCFANILHASFTEKRLENMFTANITAWSLKILTFSLSIALMLINKKRGRHTSGILFFFWLCLTFFEMFTHISAFTQLGNETGVSGGTTFVTRIMYFPLLVAEMILCSWADTRRRPPSHFGNKDGTDGLIECPEQDASFPSRMFFWWFNDLCMLGWRKPLTVEDLWQLSPENRTEYVSALFEKRFYHASESATTIGSNNKEGKNFEQSNGTTFQESTFITGRQRSCEQTRKKVNITRMLIETFWAPFACGSLIRILYVSTVFLNPVILKLIIDFMKSSDPIWKGAAFACCLLVKGYFQSVIMSCYLYRMLTLGMRIRTVLISALYKKCLVLSPGAKRESTVGEIVNLMSVDSQLFMDLLGTLNMLWSAPLQIVVAALMLWHVLGTSVFAGLLSMVTLIPLNMFLTSQTKKLQVKQMKSKDERVKLVNEVLSGIKVLKLYAWEEAFRKKIELIRTREVRQLRKKTYYFSTFAVLGIISPFLATFTTFATFLLVDENHVLDAATTFVSLLLFNILRYPLFILPDLITTMATVSVSVKRINKYLNSEELEQYVLQDPFQGHPIVVRNSDFSWSRSASDKAADHDHLTLKDINLTVQKGSLVAVVGRVGSGKSSLLSALLGDMQKLGGTVSLNGTTAYVSQLPWIQNMSVQRNILFSTPLNRDLYDEVVEACALLPDLAIFPGGDATEIGEKGINLSGGQKQRVSLARAVYSSADIYLLDDPLSAVDSHVGKHIFEKVIGPAGLLKHKTRILVTHSLTYLPQVDVIYVVKDGKIAERGSFQELVDRKSPFADCLSQCSPTADGKEEDWKKLEDVSLKNAKNLTSSSESSCRHLVRNRELSVLPVKRLTEKSSSVSSSSSTEASNSIEEPPISRKDQPDTNLTQKETTETGQVKWSVYLSYLRAVNSVGVLAMVFFFVMWQVFAVGGNFWLSDWSKDSALPNNTRNVPLRNQRLAVYGALGLGIFLFSFFAMFSIAYVTLSASNALHRRLLVNILRAPMSFFDTTPLGRIVNRFAKDMDTVDTTIPFTVRHWLITFVELASTIVVISIQTPIFLAVILPIGALYYVIQLFFVSTARQLKRLESVTWSPIYSHFSATLAGSNTIRAYRAQNRFLLQLNELVDKNQICCYPTIVSSRWLAIRLDFCGNCIIFFAALFAILQRDHLDPGEAGLSVTYALAIIPSLVWLVNTSCAMEATIVSIERVLEYTMIETEAEWIVESKRPPEDWPLRGEVQLDNYSSRYRKGLDLVLRGISCDIKSGEKIGIVGRTGAGKTSLTLSLFRIVEAAGGSISIDGLQTADLGLHDLRSKITIIPQDPVLFSGSLRMNLDPLSSYSDEKVWLALDHAHLKGFVSSLNSGLQHDIVEGGDNFSVGQRQLVCLARALLRKTQILILDEATAAVDMETDDLLQATIRREFASATVLTIAHRLNTVMDCDRIMVLDNGRVVEFESPDVLKQDKKSIFYGMAKDAGLV